MTARTRVAARPELNRQLMAMVLSGALWAISLPGCTRTGEPGDAFTVRDSVGIRLVEHGRLPSQVAPLRVEPQPVYRVGWAPGGHLFGRIVSGALFPDGRAVVADDAGAVELVALSARGTVTNVFGRNGPGPGEIDGRFSVRLLAREADTLIVQDPAARRLLFFRDTTFVREFDLGGAGYLAILNTDTDGDFLLGAPPALFGGGQYEGPWTTVPLVRVSVQTGSADTIGVLEWRRTPAFGGSNPFRSGGVVTAASGAFVTARTETPELVWLRVDGRVGQIVRWQAEQHPVSAALWARFDQGMRAELSRSPLLTAADIDRLVDDLETAVIEPVPLFGPIFSDAHDNIWVSEYPVPFSGTPPKRQGVVTRYDIFSSAGEYLGYVQTPSDFNFEILDIGTDRLLAVEEDEHGVQAVAVYGLSMQ